MEKEERHLLKEKKESPRKILERLLATAHRDDAKFDDHQGAIIGNRLKKVGYADQDESPKNLA